MRRWMHQLWLTALLCLPIAVAQDAGPTDPMRLAELLIGEGEAVTFYPDALPPGVALPLPNGARLLGSVTIGPETVEVLYEVEAGGLDWFGDSVRRVGETLRASGWRGYDSFGPAIFEAANQRSDSVVSDFCSPDGSHNASLNPNRLSSRTSLVVVRLDDFCRDDGGMGLPLPSLVLPAGVDLSGSGRSGGGDGFVATARYGTGLSDQDIFTDLARQLETQQWRVEEPEARTDGLRAAVTVEHNGSVWQGTLTVSTTRAVVEVARAR